jgi:UPF0755 protein
MKLKKKAKRRLWIFFIVLVLIAGAGVYILENHNIRIPANKEKDYLYIPTGADFSTVLNILDRKQLIRDRNSFIILARSTGYDKKVIPGRYRLNNAMTNLELVRLLRSGKQEPVKLIIKGSQSLGDFEEYVSLNLEIDKSELKQKFEDEEFLKKFNLKKETASCLVIPNTYEFYWNTSLPKFMEKIGSSYTKFWNETRTQQCLEAGLTRTEMVTLASIVENETDRADDIPRIAGVYINRLSKHMKLQADPTVKFAIGDKSIRRLYSYMLDFDSPYNTYKYYGLPPGPICIPSTQTLDAVLSYEKNDYLYFCARPDDSGYSNFTSSYRIHMQNAKNYQIYLNKKGIR